jgi:hypothetical protein
MDMRRLTTLARVEKEPVRSFDRYGWHGSSFQISVTLYATKRRASSNSASGSTARSLFILADGSYCSICVRRFTILSAPDR